MPVQRSKFQPPQVTKQRSPRRLQQEIFEPIRGLNTGTPPQNVIPGQTPFSQNVVVDDQTLIPRSGLSQYGTSQFGDEKPLGVFQADDVLGQSYFLAISDQTSSLRSNDGTAWATISSTPNSSASTAYYDHAWGYVPSLDENAVIIADGIAAPRYFSFVATAWAAVGDFESHESFARYCTFFDNRAVFFNMGSRTSLPFSTRCRWSQRGDPLEYTDIDAGFEDLVDMRGEGTGIHSEQDRMVLFTEEETWIARSRRDQYVFEFFPISREVGNPHPRSASVTDKGLIWLDRELRFRLLSGNQVFTFNDRTQKFLKDNMKEATEVWSTFQQDDGRYKFHFSDTTGQFPTRALWLKTNSITADQANPNVLDGVWEHQDIPDETSAGHSELILTSNGTAYRFRSDQTTDDGTAIDWRWRSHAFRLSREPDTKESIVNAWVDTDADSASSLSFYYSTDLGENFTHAGEVALSAAPITSHLPFFSPAARFQQIEIRGDDGGTPRISNIRLEMRQYTGRF